MLYWVQTIEKTHSNVESTKQYTGYLLDNRELALATALQLNETEITNSEPRNSEVVVKSFESIEDCLQEDKSMNKNLILKLHNKCQREQYYDYILLDNEHKLRHVWYPDALDMSCEEYPDDWIPCWQCILDKNYLVDFQYDLDKAFRPYQSLNLELNAVCSLIQELVEDTLSRYSIDYKLDMIELDY